MEKNSIIPSALTCLILAGGLGTRLRSVVPDRPKVLADVNGQPFAIILLEKLYTEGIRDVVFCTGFLADMVRNTLGTSYKRMSLRYSEETSPLGTGGALREACDMMNSDPVLVVNGDSYVDFALTPFIKVFEEKECNAAMVLVGVQDTQRYGKTEIGNDGNIVSFKEKNGSSGPGWINAGVYLLQTDIIASIPPGCFVSLENDLFQQLLDTRFYGFTCNARFIDIGTKESYHSSGKFFRR